MSFTNLQKPNDQAGSGVAQAPESTGVQLIASERRRQIEIEKWTPEQDDAHNLGQMAGAAACYALNACGFLNPHLIEAYRPPVTHKVRVWPWADSWWKPTPENRIRDLTKAGALIAAEIDRLQRAASKVNENAELHGE